MRSTRVATQTNRSTPKKRDHHAAKANGTRRSKKRQSQVQSWKRHRCPECKYCTWHRIDADGPQQPFCGNHQTKKFPHPIGWLHANSPACRLFQITDTTVPKTIHPDQSLIPPEEKRINFARLDTTMFQIASFGSTLLMVAKVIGEEIHNLFS